MTYLYRRQDGTTFEFVQSMKDEPLTECPTTGQPVSRIPYSGNRNSIVFKGPGWTLPSKGVSQLPLGTK